MLVALEVLTALLVAGAMSLSLAHALELPGKLRLSKEEYLAVQPIYYPGFTIGGLVFDAGGTIATLILLLVTPAGSAQFWLTAGALAALVGMNAIFWIMTQPVNKVWLQETKLSAYAKGFFRTQGNGEARRELGPEWTQLRDQWERSHVLRAIAAMTGLILVLTAIAL